ncbi:TetR/AcrR family transcriptional regulator [Paenibacillus athensensis]|uniref:HTH tetR-type domain-containing protein n=1 Tax=Paenibacillus athensensis TaxID=1967502 RepID=A0A4Y8QB30_9BACL|nr:TetR/AcrR family transcriptional regulator [Paenibacillus athensensis]MCD1259058.1 TetR/AcrR family transcriptional regulator [Paenibacillus athensensis]
MELLDKKERILRAAEHLFTLYGIKSTTVEQIAKQAQVGKGTVYLIFADKETLFGEVLQRNWESFSEETVAGLDDSLGFLATIDYWLTRMTLHRAQDPLFHKVYTEFLDFGTPEIGQGIKRLQLLAVCRIEELVERGAAAGELPPGIAPRMLAFMLVKSYAAFSYEWPKEFGPIGPAEVRQLLDDLLGVYSQSGKGAMNP